MPFPSHDLIGETTLDNGIVAKTSDYADFFYMTESITGFSGNDISYWFWCANFARTANGIYAVLFDPASGSYLSSYAGLSGEISGGDTLLAVSRGTGVGVSIVRNASTYDLESEATSGTAGAFISATYDYSEQNLYVYINGVLDDTINLGGNPATPSNAKLQLLGKSSTSLYGNYAVGENGVALTSLTAAQHLQLYNAVVDSAPG